MKRILFFTLGATLLSLNACDLIGKPQEQVEDLLDGDIEAVVGTWTLNEVNYVYEIEENDIWRTEVDTIYPDSKGFLEIEADGEDDVLGQYDFTFNDTAAAYTFTGDYTVITPGIYALSIKTTGDNFMFNTSIFVDFLIEEASETTLRLNRKRLVPSTAVSPGERENWYLEFSKQ